jgi:hypothetical protein
VELLDKGTNHIHVLNTVIKRTESLVVLDVFVLGKLRGSLILLHVLEEKLKVIGVDIVPKGLLPGLELAIDNGDEIPHLLELDKLILAVVELLLLCPLKLEE